MIRGLAALALVLAAAPAGPQSDGDWRLWRGPSGNGIAADGQDPPVTWSESQNVVWKAAVPGRGHSSPTIVGDRIFLTTADEDRQVQSVLAFDRKDGKSAWKTDLHRGGFPRRIHPKNSHATCTVASDGERLFAVFFNGGAIHVTALDLEGNKLWQRSIGPFEPRQYEYGYAPSPTVYKSFVVIAVDYDLGGYLTALDVRTGEPAWRTVRPEKSNYASPIVARVAGRNQLLLSGCDLVAAYDPDTGKPLWSCEATTLATCGTPVWEGDLVFASGGYPKAETVCVRADGSGRIVWKNGRKCYEQSMLVRDGHVYAVDDTGVAFCWKAADGTEMWSARLGGKVSASPILAGGNIYASTERGTTHVWRADPKGFKEIARNQLGSEAFATPAISGNRIYLRVARTSGGRRQEQLYCIGKP